MRWIFGLLGMFIVAVVGFMYKTKQLETLKIPGLPGKTLADLNPQKIIETYKNTLGEVELRNQALLKGELPEEKLKAALNSNNGTIAAAARVSQDAPTGESRPAAVASGSANTNVVPANVAKNNTAPRALTTQRYGMELVKLSEGEVQPYLGQWVTKGGGTSSLQVRLSFKPERSISSVSVRAEPSTNVSIGDNSTMIWKNTKTGQVVVVINDHSYIHLEGTSPQLRGLFYKRGDDGVVFQKVFEFSLVRH
ncbi:MAG: hypothetical protein IT287_09265 [Bdellovibrionaceae bacterium]|nr:hypothetical protein [Pseudobdellovibrionaceae bacterium]